MARIVVVGATGFIGRHVVATLLERRHTVVGIHRGLTPPSLAHHPRFEAVRRDLMQMTTPESWTDLIDGADAVINCAGRLQASAKQMRTVHTDAPIALFQSCADAGPNRVIQISAISVDAETPYAETKRTADEALMKTDLDWVVVRPSLVYGNGSYGGTSVMRGLAACPWAIPIPGDGTQTFQPICMEDLVGIVCELCEADSFNKMVIEPVGPDVLELKEILLKLRRWLDIPGERKLSVPISILRPIAMLGSVLRWPNFNANTLTYLTTGDTGNTAAFKGLYAPGALNMDDVLMAQPSTSQDRRVARGALFGPLITCTLALMWIVFGALEFLYGGPVAPALKALGVSTPEPNLTNWLTSGWSALLGFLILLSSKTRLLLIFQLITVVGYTALLSWAMPSLWLDPLGPLLKNVPLLLLMWVWANTRRTQ